MSRAAQYSVLFIVQVQGLKEFILNLRNSVLDEEECYRISLEREPRDRSQSLREDRTTRARNYQKVIIGC
jgi:hypothetical protein